MRTDIFRRPPDGLGNDWVRVAASLQPGTSEWIDQEVTPGSKYEYQIRRNNSWNYGGNNYDATGYTLGCAMTDNSGYQGRMILLVAENIVTELSAKFQRLKSELTGDGWKVEVMIVPRAEGWDNGAQTLSIKNGISNIYETSPADDKPRLLFILGHVAMPRSGASAVTAPDDHDQNKGARGCDAFYADMDGIYTDVATYDPGNLQTEFAVNLPGDYRWDQDFMPSEVEIGYGRVDFADITDYSESEIILTERYLDKLSNYRNVLPGFDMGAKTAFNFGYNNSNDATFRNLLNLSNSMNVFENTTNLPHPQWVSEHGPFMVYMQNEVAPDISEWSTYGMEATMYTSDQSYWGYNDVPQKNTQYSRIRALPGGENKCLLALWTTAGANLFYQACDGRPVGLALKEVINHNVLNNKIERPPQQWDTPFWWFRTHFALIGDPSIRFYQVPPVRDLNIDFENGEAVLRWDAPLTGVGYSFHVYSSDEQFGIYEKLTDQPLDSLKFVLDNYQAGRWYMVRSVKTIISGCGSFIQPGMGVFTQSNIVLNTSELPLTLGLQERVLGNLLRWNDPQASGSMAYNIEVSMDNVVFEKLWQENYSESDIQYSYLHNNPPSGDLYYRINTKRNSGRTVFSNVVKSENVRVECFPNPTTGDLNITADFLFDQIRIIDPLGREIVNEEIAGTNHATINISHFDPGVYYILLSGNIFYKIRVIKVT